MAHGHRSCVMSVEAFAPAIQAVTFSKPTLEDVFIQLTGHRFWESTDHAEL